MSSGSGGGGSGLSPSGLFTGAPQGALSGDPGIAPAQPFTRNPNNVPTNGTEQFQLGTIAPPPNVPVPGVDPALGQNAQAAANPAMPPPPQLSTALGNPMINASTQQGPGLQAALQAILSQKAPPNPFQGAATTPNNNGSLVPRIPPPSATGLPTITPAPPQQGFPPVAPSIATAPNPFVAAQIVADTGTGNGAMASGGGGGGGSEGGGNNNETGGASGGASAGDAGAAAGNDAASGSGDSNSSENSGGGGGGTSGDGSGGLYRGGLVQQNYVGGGPVPTNAGPPGRDTVPAHLNNGEYVVNQPAVNAIGADKMSVLNHFSKLTPQQKAMVQTVLAHVLAQGNNRGVAMPQQADPRIAQQAALQQAMPQQAIQQQAAPPNPFPAPPQQPQMLPPQ